MISLLIHGFLSVNARLLIAFGTAFYAITSVQSCNYAPTFSRRFMCPGISLSSSMEKGYCKTLNICGIEISRCNENDILAYLNLGDHDIP